VEDKRPKKLPTTDEQSLKVTKKIYPRPDTGPARCPTADPSTVGPSLIRNGLHGRVAVKKPFLRKGNGEKRLSYAK